MNNVTDIIAKCINTLNNCLGGTGNFTCIYGTIGALCEVCDIYGSVWNVSFANSATYSCATCNSVQGNGYKIAMMALFTFGTTVLSVKGTYELLSKRIQMNVINSIGFLLFVSTRAGDKLSILIKILTNYF